MTDQSLAHLLAELTGKPFVDAHRLGAHLEYLFAALTKRIDFVDANGKAWAEKIEARIERLERIIKGEDTPADLVEPRPPTRLGDEFPELTATERWETVKGSELKHGDVARDPLDPKQWWDIRLNATGKLMRECIAIGDYQVNPTSTFERLIRPAPVVPTPPSKAVRVDSLPVGAECWVRATVDSRQYGRVLDFGINGALYFQPNESVLPAEPSAKGTVEAERAWHCVECEVRWLSREERTCPRCGCDPDDARYETIDVVDAGGLVRLCELHVDDEFELGGKVRVVTRVLNDGKVVTVLKEFTPGSARILSGQTLVSRVAKETAPAFSMWTAPKHDPSTAKPMVPVRELSKEEVAQVIIDAEAVEFRRKLRAAMKRLGELLSTPVHQAMGIRVEDKP